MSVTGADVQSLCSTAYKIAITRVLCSYHGIESHECISENETTEQQHNGISVTQSDFISACNHVIPSLASTDISYYDIIGNKFDRKKE